VQHKVAHRVRLLVGPPPQVLLVQNIETLPDLDGELVDHSSGDVLQKKGVHRVGHLVMISSNVHLLPELACVGDTGNASLRETSGCVSEMVAEATQHKRAAV
jgi:hypothetical protein